MKTIKVVITIIVLLCCSNAYAYYMYPYDFCVDGIYYQYGYDKYGDKIKGVVYVCSNGSPTAYSGVIEIPEKVEYNGKTLLVGGVKFNAFEGCVLDKAIFPPSIDAISGFCNASVSEVVIPEGPSVIDYCAFENCKNLKKLYLPVSIKEIGSSSFAGSDIEEINLENVEAIYDYAFANTAIKEVNIDNLTYNILEAGTFYNCINLESIAIPETITEMGEYVFAGCKNLKSIILPETITVIGYSAFEDCKNLNSITLPETITIIGYRAFAGCENLTSIEIPNIIDMPQWAFAGCKKLSQINFPETLETIGGNAFIGTQLVDIEFPASLKHIGDYAFSELNSLQSVKFGKNLTTIGNSAFDYCENLSKVDMSEVCPDDSYESRKGVIFGDKCFFQCTSLNEISLPEKTGRVGYRAFDYTLIETLDLPKDMSQFGNWDDLEPAICTLPKLKSFTFPVQCFRRQYVDLVPTDGPFFIADFTESEELENIVVKLMDPTSYQLKHTTFNSETYEKATLRVPVGTAHLYRKREGWKKFKNIVEDPTITGEYLVGIDEVFTTDNSLNAYYRNGQIRFESDSCAKVEVYDLTGKLVMQIISDNGVVDASDLEAGIYVARIVTSPDIATLKFHTH